MSVVVAEMIGIQKLLGEMGIDCVMPMSLKVDNQSALIKLAGESSSEAKHIDVRIKSVGSYAKRGILKTESGEGSRMPADMMTRAPHATRLEELKNLVVLYPN